ncbi:MAG: hypothetical protein ACM3NQ_11695 [Bacteroidales bacterium]
MNLGPRAVGVAGVDASTAICYGYASHAMITGSLGCTPSRLPLSIDAAAGVCAGAYSYWWWYNH